MGIQNLSVAATVSAGDMIPLASAGLGGDAKVSLSTLAAYLETLLTLPSGEQTIYAAPGATGFSVPQLAPATIGASVYLLLTPVADYAAGTITLPATPQDGQKVRVSSTHAVTALTVLGAGSTVNGAPTTLAANGFFALRYDGVNQSWYRFA